VCGTGLKILCSLLLQIQAVVSVEKVEIVVLGKCSVHKVVLFELLKDKEDI